MGHEAKNSMIIMTSFPFVFFLEKLFKLQFRDDGNSNICSSDRFLSVMKASFRKLVPNRVLVGPKLTKRTKSLDLVSFLIANFSKEISCQLIQLKFYRTPMLDIDFSITDKTQWLVESGAVVQRQKAFLYGHLVKIVCLKTSPVANGQQR